MVVQDVFPLLLTRLIVVLTSDALAIISHVLILIWVLVASVLLAGEISLLVTDQAVTN